MALLDIFIGVPQSKYAAFAIVAAMAVVALAMMVGKSEVPIGQKFMFVILMILIALPSVLLSLFQLTCIVTGTGLKNQRWWCGAYAWIGTVLMVIYSVLVVVVGITAMANGTDISSQMNNMMMFEDAQNKYAQEYFQNMTPQVVDIPIGPTDVPVIDTPAVKEEPVSTEYPTETTTTYIPTTEAFAVQPSATPAHPMQPSAIPSQRMPMSVHEAAPVKRKYGVEPFTPMQAEMFASF